MQQLQIMQAVQRDNVAVEKLDCELLYGLLMS